MLRSFHERGETQKEDDNRQHRTKGRESTNDGHDGRSLMWTTSVGGCSVGPWHQCHVEQLRRRSRELREPLPQEISGRLPERPFSLDHHMFIQNVRSARRGAAAGPSGVTAEHLIEAHIGQRTGCRVVVPWAQNFALFFLSLWGVFSWNSCGV